MFLDAATGQLHVLVGEVAEETGDYLAWLLHDGTWSADGFNTAEARVWAMDVQSRCSAAFDAAAARDIGFISVYVDSTGSLASSGSVGLRTVDEANLRAIIDAMDSHQRALAPLAEVYPSVSANR